MASITERLKFTGNYVDRLMSVDTMADLLSLNPSDNFNGQTVTVLKLYNRIPGDFWLVNGTASRYWRLKELPQVASIDILNQITQTCTLDTGKILIDNGFVASVKSGSTFSEYVFFDGEWLEYKKDGETGPQGPQGFVGYQGAKGPQGNIGLQGAIGFQGNDGEDGPQGADGPQGREGVQGPKGEDGEKGEDGVQGPEGPQGVVGMQGNVGPQGKDGIDGAQGSDGPQGPEGAQGLKGEDGERGEDGAQGPQGFEGPQGPKGEDGADGEKGPQGNVGPQGEKGADGTSVKILPTSAECENIGDGYIDENGDLNILYSLNPKVFKNVGPIRGEQGPEGAQGNDGPQGPEGVQGPKGEDGDKGEDGVQGPQGNEGPQGQKGEDGEKGEDGVQGPQGLKGEDGEKGEDGAQGPQGIKGEDGETGTQGPQGKDGEKGEDGTQGPQGVVGPQGEKGSDGTSVNILPSSADCEHIGDGYIDENGDLNILYELNPKKFKNVGPIRGEQGPKGPQGNLGPQGPEGIQGPQGSQGNDGPQGPKGEDGEKGEKGYQGYQGMEGPQGLKGEDGEKGEDGVQGPQGSQGNDGPQGPEGIQGPEGHQGNVGPQGNIGPQGIKGEVGAQGQQGFEGPQGPEGAQGYDGPQGNDGVQGPQGTTNIISASTAITIEDNTIGVKVAESLEEVIVSDNGKNYLRVTENNELQVDGVDTDSSVIPSEIILEGGPLAELAKQAYPDGTIPSGTTMQDLLMKLFCQEKWGSANGPTYTFNASVAAPTTNLNKSSYQPVGMIAIGSASINNTSANQYATVTGMTYGYSGTSHSNTATTYTQTVTPTKTGEATITCSWTNLVPVDNSVDGSSGASKEFYIMNGTNTYRANVTGQTVTPAEFSEETIYAMSNLDSVSEIGATISEEGFESSSAYKTGITPTNTSSKTVTGYRPVYYGAVTATSIDDNYVTENVLTGFGSSQRNVPTSYTVPTNSGAFIIAIPSGNSNYNKTNMIMRDSKGMSFGLVHVKAMSVNMLNNVETVSYKIFYITNANATTEPGTYNISFE